jgi:ABC-type proline/glycine betaine transport system ATPase subunit
MIFYLLYIDPGTGSALFSILIGAVATVYFLGCALFIKLKFILSGGQQQRVAIARTLACNPEIILFDEPRSALDAATRFSLRDEIKRIQKQFHSTMIYITHDQEEAFALSDRIMVRDNGTIQQMDTPEVIIADSANTYKKLSINLEDVVRTLGVDRFRIIRDVLVLQTRLTILEMFLCFFVDSKIFRIYYMQDNRKKQP